MSISAFILHILLNQSLVLRQLSYMSIDLHIHSSASDGTYGPEEIIEIGVAKGVTALSICDHDSLAANAAAQAAARGRLTYIPGLEISTNHGQMEIHILGYFVSPDHVPLVEELQRIRRERAARIERTVARLQELGIGLTVAEVEATARLQPGHDAALGRPHVAAALTKMGAVSSPAEAFDRYLRRGRPAFMARSCVKPEHAIALIRGAGGLPVLSHPGLMRNDGLIRELALQGLRGVEAYHTSHTARDTERYLALAEKLGLYVTGGTDSHGPTGSYPVEIGGVDVPDECAHRLLAWHEAQQDS